MSADLLEPPTETPPRDPSLRTAFHEAMAKNNVALNADGGIPRTPNETPEAPPELKVEAPAPKETPSPEPKPKQSEDGISFPDDLLEDGPKAPVENPDAIFEEAPKGPVKHEHFERVQKAAKERVAAAKAEIEQLRAEVAKAKPSSVLPEEHVKQMAELQAERDALRDKLGQSDYERTPEFEGKFTSREKNLRDMLTATAEASGADKELVLAALHLPLKKRIEMLNDAELNPAALTQITSILTQHDQLQAEKQLALTNWKQDAVTRQQQQQAAAIAHQEAAKKADQEAFEEVSKRFSETPGIKPKDGDVTALSKFERNAELAARLYSGDLNPKAVALASMKAAWFDTILERHNEAIRLANARAEEIVKLKGNGPSINGHPVNGSEPASTKGMDDNAISRNTFREAMAKHGIRT
jgi:hypothetical protein